MNHGASGAVKGFVGEHLTGQVVAVVVHRREEPHRLESDNLLHADLVVDGAGQLADVFETTVAQELEDLAVPFIVLEGVNAVVLGLDASGEHAVGQGHGGHHGHLLARGLRSVDAGFGEDGRFGAVCVHVGGHDDRRDAVVGVQQRQRDHGTDVNREAVVIDRSSRQATLFCGIAPGVGEIRIDLEIVVHGAEVVEVVVHEVPHRVRIGLDLVANDARPSGRVNDEEVGSAGLDAGGRFIEGSAQSAVAFVGVGSQQGVRMHRHHEGGDDGHAEPS